MRQVLEYRIPWWGRIKVRVLVFGIVMSIVPVAIFSAYTLFFGKSDLEKSVHIQNKLVVDQIVLEVDSLLQRTEEQLFNAAFSLQQGGSGEERRIQAYRLLNEIPMAEEVAILGPDGKMLYGVNRFLPITDRLGKDWSGPELLPQHNQQVYYGPVRFSENGVPFIEVVVPQYTGDGKQLLGGVGAKVRLNSLFTLLGMQQKVLEKEIYLVDHKGQLIAHNDFSQVLKKTDVAGSFTVQHFLRNGDSNQLPAPNQYKSYNGLEVLGVYGTIQRTGWGVIVEQPVGVAFASITALLKKLLLFLVVIISFVVIISIIFGLYFTKPIERLERAAHSVGKGALETKISSSRRDELGSLMTAFDGMTTELALKSEKLLQEKERLDTIVNGIGAGLALVYKNHRVAWMNPILEKWVQTADLVNGSMCYKLFGSADEICLGCPMKLDGGQNATENLITSLPAGNGDQRVLRHRVYHLEHVKPGEPENLIVVEDITQQRKMEEMVVQADKLSALGLMASGFAHEINNPLATIHAYAEDLEDLLKTDTDSVLETGEIYRYLRIIRDSTNRSKQITQNLLKFSRKSEWKQELVDISTLVDESLSLLHHQIGKKQVQIGLDLQEPLPKVKGDSLQLMQVLVNLLNNSLDAVDKDGKIAIQAANAGEQVFLRVKDNGKGIAKNHLANVMDPFFTTKEIGKGTGLGLSISYGIITRMGGTITIESQPGEGTDVTVTLPAPANKEGR